MAASLHVVDVVNLVHGAVDTQDLCLAEDEVVKLEVGSREVRVLGDGWLVLNFDELVSEVGTAAIVDTDTFPPLATANEAEADLVFRHVNIAVLL